MIKHYNRTVEKLSNILNYIASITLFIIMLLVVANILLRLIGKPIQATYELVGLLTSVVIGFTLAYCAVKGAHISISIFMQRFSTTTQKVVDILINLINVTFLIFVTIQMAKYAHLMGMRGEVSIATGIQTAPFIYVIAVGMGVFTLVKIGKLMNLFVKGGDV